MNNKSFTFLFGLTAFFCITIAGYLTYNFVFKHNISHWLDLSHNHTDVSDVEDGLVEELEERLALYKAGAGPDFVADPEHHFASPENPPQGNILLTASLPEESAFYDIKSYTYDISDNDFNRLYENIDELHAFVTPVEENDLNKVFMMYEDQEFDRSTADVESISFYVYDHIQNSYKELSSTESIFGRYLDLDPTGTNLAFNKLNTDPTYYANLVKTDSWDLVVVDINEDKEIFSIRGGYMPKWLNDNQIIYLKSDGLYLYTIGRDGADSSVKVLYSLSEDEGQVVATSMIDISPDNQYLLWTTSSENTISLFKINEGNSVSVEPAYQWELPDTGVFWPTFSPDSKYFVVQAIDTPKDRSIKRTNPRLEIRALGRDEVVQSQSLKEFNFDALFTDAWVE